MSKKTTVKAISLGYRNVGGDGEYTKLMGVLKGLSVGQDDPESTEIEAEFYDSPFDIFYDGNPVTMTFELANYDLANMIESFGVSPKQTRHSLEILAAPNTGMTVTFPEVRMSLVMISRATSKDQLFNTIAHEMYHATCGIIRYYGREMCSEDAAYTMGELMRQVITNVAKTYR